MNLTDGLDGLATGAAILVLAAYMIIGIWQLRNDCTVFLAPNCYDVRDPQDLAIVAATVMGACSGFLWWNAPPAKIFMGDTGSLALGGVLAGLAITTRTELLLLLLGGLFVIITLSVVIQVGSFKLTGKRVFRMAPLQHHFELAGWAETTIVVRFWIIAGICVALGLGIFYVGGVLGVVPRVMPPRGGLGGSSPRVSTEMGVVNIDDKYGRRLASSALVPVTTFSALGCGRGGLAGGRRQVGRGRQHVPADRAGRGRGGRVARAGRGVQRGQRGRRPGRAGRGGRPAGGRGGGHDRLPGRARPARAGARSRARSDLRSSTTRTSQARWRRCCARCGRSPREA